jgi:hypothetical protein
MGGFALLLTAIQDTLHAIFEPPGSGVVVWFLVGVFGWSGFVKLRHPELAAMAMVDFRVLRQVHPILGSLLGIGEMSLAVLLALGIVSQWVLLFTALLLWSFVVLIARGLWLGEKFACFCFGESDAQLSVWTLARTTLLALLASGLALTTPLRAIRSDFFSTQNFWQALSALALLGSIVLLTTIPNLWHWNEDFVKSRNRRGVETQT